MSRNKQPDLPPDFLARLDVEGFSIPELIGLILHAHGGPLDLERIAALLADLGVRRDAPSLKKAWHKMPYLRKTSDGRIALVPDQGEYTRWDHVLWMARKQFAPAQPPAAAPADPPPIDDRTPISRGEARCALATPLPGSISLRRKIALLAEASGGAIAFEDALRILAEVGANVSATDVRQSVSGTRGLVRLNEDLILELDPDDESMRVVRGIVRKHLADAAAREAQQRRYEEWKQKDDHKQRVETEERRRAYLAARKCVIRCVFCDAGFAAASVLDPDRRAFHDYTDAAAFAARLSESDLIFGLDPWADMERINAAAAPGGRLIDLSPPIKSVTFDGPGERPLAVTAERVMASTLHAAAPLGKTATLRQYIKHGDFPALFKRLRTDLKMLWRLYEYICLHRYVTADWGFAGTTIPMSWNPGRLPTAAEIIRDAAARGEELDIVLNAPPSWDDPWGRAHVVRIATEGKDACVAVTSAEDRITIAHETIYALRPHAESADDEVAWPEGCDNVC